MSESSIDATMPSQVIPFIPPESHDPTGSVPPAAQTPEQPQPRSFKVEVLEEQAESETSWTRSRIRLATWAESTTYATSLRVWMRLKSVLITATDDPVTHRQFDNGDLIELDEVAEREHLIVHSSAY